MKGEESEDRRLRKRKRESRSWRDERGELSENAE